MKLDVLDLPLYEGLLLTLGTFPAHRLWASLGHREAGLCRFFAAAYPSRSIQHYSVKSWSNLAASGENPGAYLLNLDLEIAPLVVGYAIAKRSFCLAGFFGEGSHTVEILLANLPTDVINFGVSSVEHLFEPLGLISTGHPVRMVISMPQELFGKPGNLIGVQL